MMMKWVVGVVMMCDNHCLTDASVTSISIMEKVLLGHSASHDNRNFTVWHHENWLQSLALFPGAWSRSFVAEFRCHFITSAISHLCWDVVAFALISWLLHFCCFISVCVVCFAFMLFLLHLCRGFCIRAMAFAFGSTLLGRCTLFSFCFCLLQIHFRNWDNLQEIVLRLISGSQTGERHKAEKWKEPPIFDTATVVALLRSWLHLNKGDISSNPLLKLKEFFSEISWLVTGD